MEVECPRCGLLNLGSAERCDCGYGLLSGVFEEADLGQVDRNKQLVFGRQLVVAVIAAMLTTSATVIIAFNVVRGSERLPPQIVRFALLVLISLFLYRGANWARWVTGILALVGGVLALVAGLALFLVGTVGRQAGGITNLSMLALGAIWLASGVILLFVPAVRAHFGAKKTAA